MRKRSDNADGPARWRVVCALRPEDFLPRASDAGGKTFLPISSIFISFNNCWRRWSLVFPLRLGPHDFTQQEAAGDMSVVQTVPTYTLTTYDVKSSIEEPIPIPPLPNDQKVDHVARPPIDYSSVGAFFHSSWRRFLSLWTRTFILSLLFGQIASLCITCTNVTTEELNLRNWQLPTTQSLFLYTFFFCA